MARAMLWAPLAFFAALTTLVSADVVFTSPAAGSTVAGGSAVIIEWKESGEAPALADLTTYELWLYAGGNEASAMKMLLPITASATAFTVTGNKATLAIGVDAGASSPKNAYFFKMISTAATGGTVTNYSPRFSMSGMSGTFPQNVIDGMKTVTGTTGPAKEDTTKDGAPANPAQGDYGVAYTMQTGLTRFAPMQAIPPTAITKKEKKPLFPTSDVSIATAFLPNPKFQTTITQSQTYSVSSRENTVAAAPMPSDDMAKFLNRWKD